MKSSFSVLSSLPSIGFLGSQSQLKEPLSKWALNNPTPHLTKGLATREFRNSRIAGLNVLKQRGERDRQRGGKRKRECGESMRRKEQGSDR